MEQIMCDACMHVVVLCSPVYTDIYIYICGYVFLVSYVSVSRTELVQLAQAIREVHEARHDGINGGITRLKQRGYCFGMGQLYQELVHNCRQCSEDRGATVDVPLKPIITDRPNHRWVIDLKHVGTDPQEGHSELLVVVDHFSGFTWARPLYGKDAAEIVLSLEKIINNEGCPTEIGCDNGSEFLNSALRQLCLDRQIRLVRGRPRHPQTQGKVERRHQDVGNAAIHFANRNNGLWERNLETIVAHFNTTHSSALPKGMSPFAVYRGREPTVLRHGECVTLSKTGSMIVLAAEERQVMYNQVKQHMINKGVAQVARHAKQNRVVFSRWEKGTVQISRPMFNSLFSTPKN